MILLPASVVGAGFLPYGKKAIIALRQRGSMLLSRPAAGGESCQQSFFIYFYLFSGERGMGFLWPANYPVYLL